jgi:hypothetical protein
MLREWDGAGWGSRTVFVIAALYWATMVVLFLFSLRFAGSVGEIVEIAGFYFVPLLYAIVLRAASVAFLPRSRRFWSWWLLVIGAVTGILVTVSRIALSSVGLG